MSQDLDLTDPAMVRRLLRLLVLHDDGLRQVTDKFNDADRNVTLGTLDRDVQRLRLDCDALETLLKNGSGLLIRCVNIEHRLSDLEKENQSKSKQTEKTSMRKWDVALLMLGFLLSSVLGAAIGQWLQHMAK
jgi:hypothetical protein